MFQQYGHLDSDFWRQVVDILSHSAKWPRFTDIDDVIKSLREKAEGERVMKALPKPASLHKANIAKIHAIVEHIFKHGSFNGLIQPVSEDFKAYAKKLFPDCNDEFIRRNYCDIAAVQKQDTICELCSAGVLTEGCPVYGHKQFLRIDKRGGNTYICADSNICSRYSRSV